MPRTAFVSHEDSALHDPGWNHPDHQGRLPAIVRAVQRELPALWEPLLQREAVPASEADLLRVHDPEHVRRVAAAVEGARVAGRTLEVDGVPVSGASLAAALASVGAALSATRIVLSGEAPAAFALARPPGRDARPERSSGCSLFNTVAIAARHAIGEGLAGSILVVAWGDAPPEGLAACVAPEAAVRLASVHRGVVPPGAGGETFRRGQRGVLAAAAEEGPFDLLLLSAGFEFLDGDPEGGLSVAPGEVHGLTSELAAWARVHAAGRLVSVLEGGYAAGPTSRAVIGHLRALAGLPPA
jgi:acetoin utilization deacetylase AcuC-like enzyme